MCEVPPNGKKLRSSKKIQKAKLHGQHEDDGVDDKDVGSSYFDVSTSAEATDKRLSLIHI